MPDILLIYIEDKRLAKGATVEDTLNIVLESLQKESLNIKEGPFKNELISACAVALNGLGKIKDPVKLYRNLGLAFEKRGYCVYTQTVVNSFNRLYGNSIRQGREEEVFSVWKKFKNPLTKIAVSRHLPLNKLKPFLKHEEKDVRELTAKALVSKEDFQINEIEMLLGSPDSRIMEGACDGLILRRGLPRTFLEKLLNHPAPRVRHFASVALQPKGKTKPDMRFPLSNIRRKRGKRTRTMKKLTRHLRA